MISSNKEQKNSLIKLKDIPKSLDEVISDTIHKINELYNKEGPRSIENIVREILGFEEIKSQSGSDGILKEDFRSLSTWSETSKDGSTIQDNIQVSLEVKTSKDGIGSGDISKLVGDMKREDSTMALIVGRFLTPNSEESIIEMRSKKIDIRFISFVDLASLYGLKTWGKQFIPDVFLPFLSPTLKVLMEIGTDMRILYDSLAEQFPGRGLGLHRFETLRTLGHIINQSYEFPIGFLVERHPKSHPLSRRHLSSRRSNP